MRLRVVIAVAVVAAAAYLGWRNRHRVTGPDVDEPPPVARRDAVADAGSGEPDAGPIAPPWQSARDGDRLTIELLAPPASHYMGLTEDDAVDAEYRAAVEAVASAGVTYDRHLSRAAREMAFQWAVLGEHPPDAALMLLLHSAGAPDYTAGRFGLRTTSDEPEVVRDAVRRALRNAPDGPLAIGVGEAATPDEELTRTICVVIARRPYGIDTTPRHAELDAEWVVRGELPPGYREPLGSVMYPTGRIERFDVVTDGRRFELSVPTGSVPGTLLVGIDGVGATGPGKLLQLSVEVGRPPPRTLFVDIAPEDPAFDDLAAAERHAVELINADRAALGLPALAVDPELAAIARGHSVDMRDHAFFGHSSPRTGLAGDRLEAAGYRANAHAENLAVNDTLGEAQASLMASVGHRSNLVSEHVTHVGVGLARRDRDGDTEWHVTQLFARPVEDVDPAAAAASLAGRVDRARAADGLEPLPRDAALAAVAQRGARRAVELDLEEVAELVGDDLRAAGPGGAAIAVFVVPELDGLELPATTRDPEATGLGVGVYQDPDDPRGRIGVVIIVGR